MTKYKLALRNCNWLGKFPFLEISWWIQQKGKSVWRHFWQITSLTFTPFRTVFTVDAIRPGLTQQRLQFVSCKSGVELTRVEHDLTLSIFGIMPLPHKFAHVWICAYMLDLCLFFSLFYYFLMVITHSKNTLLSIHTAYILYLPKMCLGTGFKLGPADSWDDDITQLHLLRGVPSA